MYNLSTFTFIGAFDTLPINYQNKSIKLGSVCICKGNIYAYTGTWDLIKDDNEIFGIEYTILKKKFMNKFGSLSIEFMKNVPNDINTDSWDCEFWKNTKLIIDQINEGTFFDPDEAHSISAINGIEYLINYEDPLYVYQYSFASIAEAVFNQLNEDKIPFSDLKYVSEFYINFMGFYSLIEFLFSIKEQERKEDKDDS